MIENALDKERFRHELKYVVALKDVDSLFYDIAPYCNYDQHAGETKSYEIASIYYDTKDLRFYMDREESVGYRRKIRLRSYNNNGNAEALFVEIKERHKQHVNKKRVNLKSDNILKDRYPHDKLPLNVILEQLEDTAVSRELAYLNKRLELFPVVLIRYIRKALIPYNEPDMRITLDTKITAGGQEINCSQPDKEQWIIDPAHGVLEVKFNRTAPLWLRSAMLRYEISQTRFSKYCLGVDAYYGPARPWIPSSALKEGVQLKQVA